LMEQPSVVTLSTLAEGAVLELFQAELNKVLDNIADVNTDPEAKREISIKVRIAPNEKREMADVVVDVTSKLGSFKPVSTLMYLAKHRGENVAVEHNPKQLSLPAEPPAKFPQAAPQGEV
jgi:hypothetical protein